MPHCCPCPKASAASDCRGPSLPTGHTLCLGASLPPGLQSLPTWRRPSPHLDLPRGDPHCLEQTTANKSAVKEGDGSLSGVPSLLGALPDPSPALPPRVQQASHQGSLTRGLVSVAVMSTVRDGVLLTPGLTQGPCYHEVGAALGSGGGGVGFQHTPLAGQEGMGSGEQGRERTECCRK